MRPGGQGQARVLLYALAPADAGGTDAGGAVEEAYHAISQELTGTPGLIRNELLRSAADPREFVVLSHWESLAAFRTWESGAGHRAATSPLRPFQDRRRHPPFGIYQVSAAYCDRTEQP
jgi:heme oxygenase (mycobilin-producing)